MLRTFGDGLRRGAVCAWSLEATGRDPLVGVGEVTGGVDSPFSLSDLVVCFTAVTSTFFFLFAGFRLTLAT